MTENKIFWQFFSQAPSVTRSCSALAVAVGAIVILATIGPLAKYSELETY